MKDHEKKEQDKEFEKILADFDTILEDFNEDKNIKILEYINKFLYEESLLTGEKSHVDVKQDFLNLVFDKCTDSAVKDLKEEKELIKVFPEVH